MTDTTATTISLSWSPPEESEINGIITSYTIRYNVVEQLGVANPDDTVLTMMVAGTINEATLMDLFNFTTYRISITATTIAEGPADSLTQQTDENGL